MADLKELMGADAEVVKRAVITEVRNQMMPKQKTGEELIAKESVDLPLWARDLVEDVTTNSPDHLVTFLYSAIQGTVYGLKEQKGFEHINARRLLMKEIEKPTKSFYLHLKVWVDKKHGIQEMISTADTVDFIYGLLHPDNDLRLKLGIVGDAERKGLIKRRKQILKLLDSVECNHDSTSDHPGYPDFTERFDYSLRWALEDAFVQVCALLNPSTVSVIYAPDNFYDNVMNEDLSDNAMYLTSALKIWLK